MSLDGSTGSIFVESAFGNSRKYSRHGIYPDLGLNYYLIIIITSSSSSLISYISTYSLFNEAGCLDSVGGELVSEKKIYEEYLECDVDEVEALAKQ